MPIPLSFLSAGSCRNFTSRAISTLRVARLNGPAPGAGNSIEIAGVDGKMYSAQLVELPFYGREKRIRRGLDPIEG